MNTFARRMIAALYAFIVLLAIGANTTKGLIHAIAQNAPKCETEDQTGFCFYDAQTSGNGQGRSFLVIGDNILYLDF